MIPNLANAELFALMQARDEEEWNSICDAVKKRREGVYPTDWYDKVIQSGLAYRKTKEFAGRS